MEKISVVKAWIAVGFLSICCLGFSQSTEVQGPLRSTPAPKPKGPGQKKDDSIIIKAQKAGVSTGKPEDKLNQEKEAAQNKPGGKVGHDELNDAMDEQMISIPAAKKGALNVPEGRELVSVDFPEPTDIQNVIKAVSLWTGKNVMLDRNVTGKIQIISPKKVTKEVAYEAFLSALSMLGLTTEDTGDMIKIVKFSAAVKGSRKTFYGANWAPRTDEVITQIIPLKYIDAKQVQSTLRQIVSANSMIAYEPTNTLIISDSGYKVLRILSILELLDVQSQQNKVLIVPAKYSDAKSIADKVNQILQASSKNRGGGSGSGYNTFKILTDDKSNSVIIFGPPRTIKDVRELVKQFDIKIDDPTMQASIHVRPLDYADAKKLAATLSSLMQGGGNKSGSPSPFSRPLTSSLGKKDSAPSVAELGDGVKVTADESSNSLLITGSRVAYDALNTLIRKLDVRRAQVYVEAEILDLTEGNGLVFGTSIFSGWGKESGAKGVVGWEAARMAPLIVASSDNGMAGASKATNAAGVAGAFADSMNIGILSGTSINVPGLGNFTPGALINLVKTDQNTKILSSPHILTSNNEEASITVGSQVYFNSSAVNPTTGTPVPKVEKEEVALTLTITPNISHSNYVTLKLDLENNTITAIDPTTKLPQVAKRKSKQIVIVKNSQTIVISGLVNHTESEVYKKIPLLGDIPLLGWLFRNSSVSSSKNNLVIFLTPHIVHGAEDLAVIYKNKLADRDKFFEGVYGSNYKNDKFYEKLPTVEKGEFNATPIDKAEQQRLDQQRKEIFQILGYEKDDEPVARRKEAEVAVPVSSGDGEYGEEIGVGSLEEPPPVIPPKAGVLSPAGELIEPGGDLEQAQPVPASDDKNKGR